LEAEGRVVILNRIATLDILRFFAALAVVLYHYVARPEATAFQSFEPIVRYGYLGVPIFFMISGYVISLSAENRSAYQFAVSRIVRLYPALWFSVLFTVVVASMFTDQTFTLIQVLSNFTLLNDYLGISNIDGVYWTLQAELKFYACVFLLVLTGVFKHYKVWLSIWLGSACLYAFTKQPFFMGWFISPSYSAFFIAGVCFYLIQKHGFNVYNLSVLALTSSLSGYYTYQQAASFIHNASASDAENASVVILVGILLFVCIAKNVIVINGGRFAYALGAITYPLYLLHNSAGKALIDAPLFAGLGEGAMVSLVIILMIGLSYAVCSFVERPLAKRLKNFLL
jgi:peptidoglycan/LPS O-acetylase OafA/YrhL